MIEFELGVDALWATRMGYSPLGELACSLRALGSPGSVPLLRPLLRHVPGQVAAEDLRLLRLAVPDGRFVPDFLYPADLDPSVSLDDQLAGVEALSLARYEAELSQVWAPAPVPAPLSGESGRAQLVRALHNYAEHVLAPIRPHLRAALDAEVGQRAERATRDGLNGMFTDLHPEIRVDGTRLTITKAHHACTGLARASITLVPSVFVWPRLVVVNRSPGNVQLHYPVREIGRTWGDIGSTNRSEDALAALIGATRASILRDLTIPRSTSQLAQMLGISPGGISTHLSILRRNGLVTATRHGRSVLYRRTMLGTSVAAVGVDISDTR
ncbi:DUF5937 family protein [Spirillospora sp. NPDC049024]